MGTKSYFALGFFGYLYFLLSSLPIGLVWPLLRVDPAVLRLEEISGTPWSGRVGTVVLAHFELGPLQWKVRSDLLWKLMPQVDFSLDGLGGVHMQGSVAVEKGPVVHIKDFIFKSPLASLSPLMVRVPVELVGHVDGRVNHLVVNSEGRVVAIDAGGTLMDIKIGVPWQKDLGGYVMEAMLGIDGEVFIRIKDSDGVMKTSLILKIYHDGRYLLRGNLRAGKKMDEQLANILKQMMGFDRTKDFPVRESGSLQALM